MLAFNRNEKPARLRPLVMGLQRPDPTGLAAASVIEEEFSEAAVFLHICSAQYLSGRFSFDCIFPVRLWLSHVWLPRLVL